jgi:hypothetical protein
MNDFTINIYPSTQMQYDNNMKIVV